MTPISRGFGGRRRDDVDSLRIPPGQYYERGFPVLSAAPTPRTPLEEWTFSIQGAVDEARSWTWDEFTALPAEGVTVDIHCVTKWSKLDTRWKGVSVDTLLDGRRDRGRLGDRVRGRRLHDEHGARERDRRAGMDRLRVRRCAVARRPGPSRPISWTR
jgi:DMSO/TMAO reductase YedYZ molybdopterin-dependent catalytic subunit